MIQNPQIAFFDTGYAIRFIRNNWTVLLWCQDLWSKKMKSEVAGLPIIQFTNKREAEQEVRDIVVPYLLENKDINPSDIVGW